MKERMEKVKSLVVKHWDKAALASALVLAGSSSAFASSGLQPVTTAIEAVTGEVKTEAAKVIAAGIGVGVLFWGARYLWKSFRAIP